ncbi:MAG: YraN family protein [Lachnospiraceae bacterium]|jgi:putative endonuclease|nr:YraN family protein [Lachnospiraceae bacterium]
MENFNKRQIGGDFEKIAALYLKQKGYEILTYNFRSRTAEIDLVAKDKEYIVFVEVKYRRGTAKGFPQEAVTDKKQKVISSCALWYLTKNHMWGRPCRFDVVAIMGEVGETPKVVSHIENAFEFAAYH